MANTLRFKRGLVATIPTAAAGEPLFTTDTFDLYIGNGTTNTRFQKYIASGTTSQYLRGDGSLATFPSLTGFVPYTGATANVDLGTHTILAQNATIASSGSGNTATITHSSGSGIALNITKGGNGEGLYINKTSGSGNAATIIGTLNATTLVKSGGTSSQYLMADGSTSTLTNPVTGTGTTNYLPKWTSGSAIGNSAITDDGTTVTLVSRALSGTSATFSGNVGIGMNPLSQLMVYGASETSNEVDGLRIRRNSTGADIRDLSININSGIVNFKTINNSGGKIGYKWLLKDSASEIEAMRLDASGNLGLGVVPSAWGVTAFQRGSSSFFEYSTNNTIVASNYYYPGGANNLYMNNGYASFYQQYNGQHAWYNAPSGTAGQPITFTQAMTLTANGRLLLGTTSEGTQRLQVAGTMSVTGASTLSGAVTMNAAVTGNNPILELSNSNTLALEFTDLGQAANNRKWQFNANSGVFYFRAFNDARSSFTEIMQFTRSGAATFSSSVTAVSGFIAGSGIAGRNALTQSDFRIAAPNDMNILNAIAANASMTIKSDFYGGGSATPLILQSASNSNQLYLSTTGDVGIGMTPSYKIDVTGQARVSDAIAIGTTPDTNKPFKILKNINDTVGIRFENTSTGSSAFSAIQMGTDVSGGTKFTNIVYASSGVAASGVYQPDGTSLINNGSGGLNFLGNPIRMYTGGSNGTLRWDMTNDGFITQYTGTNPSTNATDGYRQYSADVVAGNAAPHFRTENGAVIKLYQETTAVGNSTISVGGGNAVLDDTEFGGYTLRQVVKALQNQGILA